MDAQRLCHLFKKAVGNLKHDANAVAGLALGVLAGPVLQILHDVECLIDCLMGLDAFDVGNRPDSAVVMLKTRVVQSWLFLFGIHKHTSFLLAEGSVWGDISWGNFRLFFYSGDDTTFFSFCK